jgi:hypothetical protein
MSLVQLSINVSDFDAAVAFYSRLFGAAPAKLRPGYANFAITIHIRFEPRISLAGRRLMSMSTAVLRTASATAAAMISLRWRSLKSLHHLAMTSSAYMHRPWWPVPYIGRR